MFLKSVTRTDLDPPHNVKNVTLFFLSFNEGFPNQSFSSAVISIFFIVFKNLSKIYLSILIFFGEDGSDKTFLLFFPWFLILLTFSVCFNVLVFERIFGPQFFSGFIWNRFKLFFLDSGLASGCSSKQILSSNSSIFDIIVLDKILSLILNDVIARYSQSRASLAKVILHLPNVPGPGPHHAPQKAGRGVCLDPVLK